MLRSLIQMALVLTATCALLIVGVRLQPQSNHAQTLLGACALPCWDGIQPGVIAPQEAVAHMMAINQFAPSQKSCEQAHPFTCQHYVWAQSGASSVYDDLQIDSGYVDAVTTENPGFTLGEAILAMSNLHVDFDGAYSNTMDNHLLFYTDLRFEGLRLYMEVVVPCATASFDLMQTPIRTLEIDWQPVTNAPLAPLADMFRQFYQACKPELQ